VSDVREALERILSSDDFDASPRSRAFLRFIVEDTLAGRQDGISQDAIATRVFHLRKDFDPTLDPIVRVQAGRLRRSLERYYLLAGGSDPIRIELPRGTYVPLVTRAIPVAEAHAAEARTADHDWPWVVVLPVEARPAHPVLDAIASRFHEQLILEMGRYRDVRVALGGGARRDDSTQRGYELSSRLTRDPDGTWVTSQVVDRRTRRQVWAQAFRGAPDGSESFYAETARLVAARLGSEQGVVAQTLWVEQRRHPPAEQTAYGAVLRSYQFLFNRDAADFVPAVEALEKVVSADPECGLAWIQLSRLYSANYATECVAVDTPIEQALTQAQRGVRLDPTGQRARAALACALLLKGELAASRAEAQAALDLNPGSLVYLEWLGWVMTMSGDWERGPVLVRKAVERNPYRMPVAFHALWADHLRRGEVDAAYRAALQYPETVFWRPLMRACCLGHLGRRAGAGGEVAELLSMKPDFARRGRTLIGRLLKSPDLLEWAVEGLAKAGVALD
jgi:tetratricopeptide (TPR) repeat protein